MINTILFDYDGTLMDTYPNITRYLKLALKDFGIDADQTEILERMMVRIPVAIQQYAEQYSLPELRARYDMYYANEPNDLVEPFEGVREVLRQIRVNGGFNYIFTHRNRSIHAMLKRAGIDGEFREIITSEDPGFAAKPAPDTILYLMEKYGGTKEDTVMIGDRQCDLGSAYGADCKTIHLLTPAVPQYPACDWRINNFYEMLEMLK
jgi:phosphoglycolate phosphatase-like HAD superfamily hydrolase